MQSIAIVLSKSAVRHTDCVTVSSGVVSPKYNNKYSDTLSFVYKVSWLILLLNLSIFKSAKSTTLIDSMISYFSIIHQSIVMPHSAHQTNYPINTHNPYQKQSQKTRIQKPKLKNHYFCQTNKNKETYQQQNIQHKRRH